MALPKGQRLLMCMCFWLLLSVAGCKESTPRFSPVGQTVGTLLAEKHSIFPPDAEVREFGKGLRGEDLAAAITLLEGPATDKSTKGLLVVALGFSGDEEAVPVLKRTAVERSRERFVRGKTLGDVAVLSIGLIGSETALDALQGLLLSKEVERTTKLYAVEMLGVLGNERTAELLDEFIEATPRSEISLQSRARRARERIRKRKQGEGHDTVLDVKFTYACATWNVRSHMKYWVPEVEKATAGHQCFPEMSPVFLLGKLKVGDPVAAIWLGFKGEVSAIPLLRTLASGERSHLREASAYALGLIGGDAGAEAAREYVVGEGPDWERAIQGLAASGAETALPMLRSIESNLEAGPKKDYVSGMIEKMSKQK